MELKLDHQPAAHCENGAISTLLRFYGLRLSEPMIFGLASGLFFSHMTFIKMSGMPVTSFRTFPGVLFRRIMRLFGIKSKTRRFLNPEKAMKALDKKLVEEGKPVGCVVGMYYLPYMPFEYRFHFNGHNICIVGKNEQTNEYTVLDANAIEKVTISREDLIKVRYAKGGTYPLYGQMYWIERMPEKLPDLSPLIIKAISKTCYNMVSEPKFINFVGVNGILHLSKRIRKWEKLYGSRKARLNLAQVVRMLEEIGTGGAGFRFMFGAFLQEAAIATGIDEFKDYSKRITKTGDLWREFAYGASKIIKNRNDNEYTFDGLGDLLERIASEEREFFTDLWAFVKSAKPQKEMFLSYDNR